MGKAYAYFLKFSEKSINYVSQLFSKNGSIKNGMNLRGNTTYMKVHRLIATNLVIHDHHLIKG